MSVAPTPVGAVIAADAIAIEIGGVCGVVRTKNVRFRRMLLERYRNFLSAAWEPKFELEVELLAVPDSPDLDADLEVSLRGGTWQLRRGDFSVTWDAATGRGKVRQTANPYSIDTVLRVLHSLLLAGEGGFLLHAASVIRSGKAFVFAGLSGAGKTTISRLAPPDVTLLSDEISYLRPRGGSFRAYGTPFAGELSKAGENCSAPVAAVYLLDKGSENRVTPLSPSAAVRALMRSILFFAQSAELVGSVFQSACNFVAEVPVKRLTFAPDQRVWQTIG